MSTHQKLLAIQTSIWFNQNTVDRWNDQSITLRHEQILLMLGFIVVHFPSYRIQSQLKWIIQYRWKGKKAQQINIPWNCRICIIPIDRYRQKWIPFLFYHGLYVHVNCVCMRQNMKNVHVFFIISCLKKQKKMNRKNKLFLGILSEVSKVFK